MSLVEESGRVVPSTSSGYSFGSCNALHKKRCHGCFGSFALLDVTDPGWLASTNNVRLMTLWTSCMMLCSANRCWRYLSTTFSQFVSSTKKKEPVGRESGEGDGGAAVEAEDGVGGRARTVRRIHLCRLQALSWLFPRQRWQCQEWQYKDENDNTSEEY